MNKAWLGYLSSLLFLFAGVFQFMAGKIFLGCLFTLLAVASVALNIYIARNQKSGKD